MKTAARVTLLTCMLSILVVGNLFAEEFVQYQIKVYKLPDIDVSDVLITELIEKSELTHEPSLLVELGEDAFVEIGNESSNMLKISLVGSRDPNVYTINLRQKELKGKDWHEVSYFIPEVGIGEEMYSVVNTGDWKRLFYFSSVKKTKNE